MIEIPTPRWTAYDQKRFGVKAPLGTRLTITERAYTSPLWYTAPKPRTNTIEMARNIYSRGHATKNGPEIQADLFYTLR